jgi:PAS domain S-box-containing protein
MPSRRPRLQLPLRLSLLYAASALLWIVGSDLILGRLLDFPPSMAVINLAKGFLFVVLTSVLLWAFLRRWLRDEADARAQAEEVARKLQTIFETSSDGIVVLENGRFVSGNPRALDLFGVSEQDFVGRQLAEFSPEAQPDGQSSRQAIQVRIDAALQGKPQCFFWHHRRQDGTVFTAEINLRACHMGDRSVLLAALRDITERLRAENALRDSEERLRRLYESMSEGLALHEIVNQANGVAVDYRILDVNPAYERITGLDRFSVVGKLASEAYQTSPPPHLETYAAVATSGQATSFESFFEPWGKDFIVSVFCPRHGQFATVFADISERKDAERQVVLLNQVFTLISRVNEAIVRLSDRQTLFQETCRIAADLAQFELAWVGWWDGAAGELRPVASAGHEEGFLTGTGAGEHSCSQSRRPVETVVQESRVVLCQDIEQDPDTQPWRAAALARNYRSFISLPLKQGGVTVGAFTVYANVPRFFSAIVTESLIEVAADVSFALDLFERNRQREVERQQLRLQNSALEAAANAIVITDRAGLVQWANDAFTRLSGYKREEAVGHTLRMLKSGVHRPEFYRDLWASVLAGSVWQGSLTNRRKDGTLYEEEMTVTPVRSESGAITHFIAIKQDVTERKQLEQQFLRAQRMQSVGLLAGGLAHDLNNVLAPVLMALPLLRMGLKPEERDHLIGTLEQSVRRGAGIVRQVLTFARGVEVQRTSVQVRHLIREVVRIAEETFPRDIHIRSSVPPELWAFLGDPTQIHQVLLNLAVNARDAMPDGGQLTVSAGNLELRGPRQFLGFAIPPGRYVRVTVADTGTGIKPELIDQIFEPFFTTKPPGKGTGLGLSTVLGIVKSHGGLVEVQSRPKQGAQFTFYLPAAPATPAPETTPERSSLPQGNGETVLVVDDEPGILQVAQSILETNGYRVCTAGDGKQALAKLGELGQSVQAVLTDVMMPSMDGLALTRALRQTRPSLPIVVMTGLMNPTQDEDRAPKLRELGVRHILAKPFLTDDLLAILRAALTDATNAPKPSSDNSPPGAL